MEGVCLAPRRVVWVAVLVWVAPLEVWELVRVEGVCLVTALEVCLVPRALPLVRRRVWGWRVEADCLEPLLQLARPGEGVSSATRLPEWVWGQGLLEEPACSRALRVSDCSPAATAVM